MKRFLTASLLVITLANPVVANTGSCKQAGDYAEAIMFYRQEERPLSRIMKSYEDIHARGQLTKEGLAWTKALIMHAFDNYEAEYTQAERVNVTKEFRNRVEIGCFRAESRKQ